MQADEKFNQAVQYIVEQLQSLQLTSEQWVAKIAEQTGLTVKKDFIKTPAEQFPAADGVTKQFSVDSLRRAIEDLLVESSSETKVSVGELSASARQIQLLLDLQRHFSRRKVSRGRRILNAAHRRAILTHPKGPLNQQLRASVDTSLVQGR